MDDLPAQFGGDIKEIYLFLQHGVVSEYLKRINETERNKGNSFTCQLTPHPRKKPKITPTRQKASSLSHCDCQKLIYYLNNMQRSRGRRKHE